MSEPVPSDLRDLVEKAVAPGVRIERCGKSSEREAWWFNLTWRGRPFDLWIRDFWLHEQSRDLIASLAWLAAPAPEATISGRRFWVRLKSADERDDSVFYHLGVLMALDDQEISASVQITGTARQLLQNIAGPAKRMALEFELSASITALKDNFDTVVSGGTISIDSLKTDAVVKRRRQADPVIREYVSSKLYQAYQSSNARLTLEFNHRDLDYLGISADDFERALSLVNVEGWESLGLSVHPGQAFLLGFESGLQGASGEGDTTAHTIFICHAETDKPIATVLKQYFERADHPVEVFQASHPASLPGGHEWWKEIRDALLRAPVVLTIVSPRSKERPWLYFESGGAYFKGKLVIPVVVPPERKSLPPPLGVLQGMDLGLKEDVAATVKEVGHALKVTFVGASNELWEKLRDVSERVSESSAGAPEKARADIPPWERQLRDLAARGATVQVHPIVPPAFAGDTFEIGPIDEMAIGLIKQESRHRIDIPPNRVIGIRKRGDDHILDIHGRVQWSDANEIWLYMPEDVDPKDPQGLVREIDLQAPEAQDLERKLKAVGWATAFANERRARAQLSKTFQLVYGEDGRYFRVPDRVAPLVMIKRRK